MERVVISLDNDYSVFKDSSLSFETLKKIDDECSYNIKGAFFSRLYINKLWDGKKHLFNMDSHKFPTGIVSKVITVLTDTGAEFSIEDNRVAPLRIFTFHSNFKLRDYQEEVVNKAVEAERGIINVATGGGKTIIAMSIINRLGVKTLFVVNTKEALMDTVNAAKNFFGEKFFAEYVSILDNKCKIGRYLTITTMAQLISFKTARRKKGEKEVSEESKRLAKKKYNDIVKMAGFRCIMVDECHHSGSSSWYDIVLKLNCYYRYGLTATPERTDGSGNNLLKAVSGREIAVIKAKQLQEDGYLVDMQANFVNVDKPSNLDVPLQYSEIYDKGIVRNEYRNSIILDIVKKSVGKSILILVERKEHGNILLDMLTKSGIESVFVQGNTKNRDEIKTEFMKGQRKCLIATRIYNESADIPILEVVINAAGGKSGIAVIQKVGRMLRIHKDKEKAFYWDFIDRFNIKLEEHSKGRIKLIRKEKHPVEFYSRENIK